jgi:hypothetical protein
MSLRVFRKHDAKFSGDVASMGCVVDKINEFRLVVKGKSKSIEERRFALRFLLHRLQDMHQPLHVGDNPGKGGNLTQVRWFDPHPSCTASGIPIFQQNVLAGRKLPLMLRLAGAFPSRTAERTSAG